MEKWEEENADLRTDYTHALSEIITRGLLALPEDDHGKVFSQPNKSLAASMVMAGWDKKHIDIAIAILTSCRLCS